jgi:DNA-binding NarL/FixJ family response regulator
METEIVVVDSHSIHGDLPGLAAAGAKHAGRPAPLLVVLSDADEPDQIQRILDAGAHCYLPKRLPRRFLERELGRLLIELRRKRLRPVPCEASSRRFPDATRSKAGDR